MTSKSKAPKNKPVTNKLKPFTGIVVYFDPFHFSIHRSCNCKCITLQRQNFNINEMHYPAVNPSKLKIDYERGLC